LFKPLFAVNGRKRPGILLAACGREKFLFSQKRIDRKEKAALCLGPMIANAERGFFCLG